MGRMHHMQADRKAGIGAGGGAAQSARSRECVRVAAAIGEKHGLAGGVPA